MVQRQLQQQRGHKSTRALPPAAALRVRRVHKDGESITVAFPKEAAAGVINNQLDSLTFKVGWLRSVPAAAAHACSCV